MLTGDSPVTAQAIARRLGLAEIEAEVLPERKQSAAGVLYPASGLRLSPLLAATAMALSSVCVIGNALRLRGVRL